jgi:predicted RNA-binding Zn ribbon-like protein
VVSSVPPSRAGSLELVGGALAFDFANTSSGRGTLNHQDHLRDPAHVAEWAHHARILGHSDAEWLEAAAVSNNKLGARLLREALALREAIYEIGVALADGRSPAREHIENLTNSHARALNRANLAAVKRNFGWNWPPREHPIEAVLGPIALSALTLLQQADLVRVKQCEGDECGWLFFDTTKNGSRRWCEMKVCGNRAKQKRFGAKLRDG